MRMYARSRVSRENVIASNREETKGRGEGKQHPSRGNPTGLRNGEGGGGGINKCSEKRTAGYLPLRRGKFEMIPKNEK